MSLYILDTDVLSLYERGHPRISGHVQAWKPGEAAITVITVEEQLSGWYSTVRRAVTPEQQAQAYQRLADGVGHLTAIPVLSYTLKAIARYDALKSMKLNVKKMDLRIAAITLENNAILVTRNVRDFQRVPGLVIEDWTV